MRRRLFAALWLPEHVSAAIEEIHRKDQVGARFVVPENWHVTLRFFGAADPGEIGAALDDVRFAPTTVRLGPAVDVDARRRTLFVPATGADDLAAEVVGATRQLGTEAIRPRYLGHVTLARLKKGATMPRALGTLVDASWDPTEVALVESTLRPDVARYHTVHTWPIG